MVNPPLAPRTCHRDRSPPSPPISLSARVSFTWQSSTCAASAAFLAVASSKAASSEAIFCSTAASLACVCASSRFRRLGAYQAVV